MRVVLKRISMNAFEVIECPDFIKSHIRIDVIITGDPSEDINLIDPIFVRRIKEICKDNNIEFLIIE